MRPLYTIQELAHALRLQPGTVRNKLSRGEDMPRSVLVGRRRLFPEDAVEAWLQAQEARRTTPTAEVQATVDAPKPVGRPRRPSSALAPKRGSRRRKPRNSKSRGHHSPAQIALFGKGLE
jgi:excisionase family DNA binding protein